MKKLLFALCLITNMVFSQEKIGSITIKNGEEIGKESEKIIRIAGEFDGQIYTLATKKKKHFIQVFSSDKMHLKFINEIELLDKKGKDVDFEDIVVLEDKVYVIGSHYVKKSKTFELFGYEITKQGKLSTNRKKLFSTPITKKKEKGAYYIKKSPKKNQLLIMHAALFEKEEVIQYSVKLFDKELNVLFEELNKIEFEDRRGLEFTIADMDISINEDIFIVVNESYRDKKQKKNIENFRLYSFLKAKEYKKQVAKIDLPNVEIINCQMLANNKGQVQLTGFYSSVRKSGKANKKLKGIYAVAIDPIQNKITSSKFNEFDYDTKVKLIGKRKAKKDKDVKPNYFPHSLIEKEDGGLILLSEYREVILGKSQNLGPIAIQNLTHINNEIIVTSINKDGSVRWSNVLPKEQVASFSTFSFNPFAAASNGSLTVTIGVQLNLGTVGKGPEYLGAIPVYEHGQLKVLFNDTPRNIGNIDIDEVKKMKNYNAAIPTVFDFDSDNGKITRHDQKVLNKKVLKPRPGVYYRKSPNEYIIYSSKGSKDKLGRLIIE